MNQIRRTHEIHQNLISFFHCRGGETQADPGARGETAGVPAQGGVQRLLRPGAALGGPAQEVHRAHGRPLQRRPLRALDSPPRRRAAT